MKIDMEDFPTLKEYLLDNLPQGGRLGLDGRIVSQGAFEEIAGYLKKKDIELVSNLDLVGDIWTDRPALPKAKAWLHDLKFTGLTAAEKLANVRAKMTKGAYDYALYAGLDDICWLFNFRGGDVPYNPVVLSYALISQDEARLFIDLDKVDQKLRSYMKENGVTLVAYEDLISHLKQLPAGTMVLNRDRIGTAFYTAIPAHMEISSELDYPHMLKAELNEVELANVRNSSLRDSVALTRFIFWVKDQAAQGAADLNELNVLDKLYDLRKQGEYFVDISFNPISAYGSNAAMMHYCLLRTIMPNSSQANST